MKRNNENGKGNIFVISALFSKQPGHSQHSTSFHITALGQSNVDSTQRAIEDCVRAYSGEETVTAQYIDKFTKQEIADITSLQSEDVSVSIGNISGNLLLYVFNI